MRSAVWVRRLDPQLRVRLVAYQDAGTPPLCPEIVARWEAQPTAFLVRPDGEVITDARSILHALARVGYHPWLMRFLARRPIGDVADLVYRRIVSPYRRYFALVFFRNLPRVKPEH